MKTLIITAMLLSSCAYDSTLTEKETGVFVISSVESDAGASANALEWEVDQQGARACPRGFEQVAQQKRRAGLDTTVTTTIRCVQ